MDRQALRYIHIGGHGRKIVPILDACVHSVRKNWQGPLRHIPYIGTYTRGVRLQ